MAVPVEKPRTVGRQRNLENPELKDKGPEAYFRVTVFNQMVDHFTQEMTRRFSDETNTAFLSSLFIPSHIGKYSDLEVQEKIKPLLQMYHNDLPSISHIDTEISGWVSMWQNYGSEDIPSTVLETLEKCKCDRFPNIHSLLSLLAVLPVTTCEAERSFSTLKRLKTYLRSTMGQDRLISLALMNVHRDILFNIDVDSIVNDYCSSGRRGIARL